MFILSELHQRQHQSIRKINSVVYDSPVSILSLLNFFLLAPVLPIFLLSPAPSFPLSQSLLFPAPVSLLLPRLVPLLLPLSGVPYLPTTPPDPAAAAKVGAENQYLLLREQQLLHQ